jgi:hypothetical protein
MGGEQSRIKVDMVCGVLSAQQTQQQDENAVRTAAGNTPVYRVTVTARTAKAINYQHRGGAIQEAKRLDPREAPQRDAERAAQVEEAERVKLDKARLLNKAKFRP